MRKMSRWFVFVSLAIVLWAAVAPAPAALLTNEQLTTLTGAGFWCDFGSGAALVLGIAGFANPAFGVAGLVITAVVVIAC